MRKILPVFILFLFALEAFAGGRPIQIIRCVDRGLEDTDTDFFRSSTLKGVGVDTTDRICYGAPLNITGFEPADICIGDATTLHTIIITGDKMGIDTLLPGDAITIGGLTNFNLTEDPNNFVGTASGDARTAFTAIADPADPTKGIVQVEFTRDPFSPSTLILASATFNGSSTLTIPACLTVTPVSTVPTMGQWGLMSLGLLLLILGVNAVRQTVSSRQTIVE